MHDECCFGGVSSVLRQGERLLKSERYEGNGRCHLLLVMQSFEFNPDDKMTALSDRSIP
jgi:hypothetical protein